MKYFVRLMMCFIYLTFPLHAASSFPPSHVNVELIQEDETIKAGHPFWVALHLEIEPEWHAYWKNPGDAGIPLKVEWNLPAGFEAGPLEWPFPEKFTVEDMVGFGYAGEVVLLTKITPPATIDAAEINLSANVRWLVCSSTTCQPGMKPIQKMLKVASSTPVSSPTRTDFFTNTRSKLPKSQIAFTTLQKEGVVQIQVPASKQKSESVVGVYFFPEEQNMIDHTVNPILSNSADQSDADSKFLVCLKGGEQIGAKNKSLKGVLVVHTTEDIQAFDIDSPIHDADSNDLISFTEAPFKKGGDASIGPSLSIESSTQAAKTPVEFEGGLALALLFAFLGGMILNLMPCVLPVISFKVMSFVKMAGASRSATLKQGLLFSAGVLVSFWMLAGAILILRAYGQSVGWGFQLQEPLFVATLATVLFVFSLSLFGVFEWGMMFASWAGQTEVDAKQKSSGNASSFFSGVLATAVATPCTGPFLGSAIGFAVTLPAFPALLIFTSLGLGMCFPYLLLAAFPSFLRFMPKPGAWMETFKQMMGFMLLATVLWLLWVFSAQTNTLALMSLLGAFFFFSIGAWIYGRWSSPIISKKTRIAAYAIATGFMVLGCATIILPRGLWSIEDSNGAGTHVASDGWETFSPERVAELREQGRPILIDFTAKWCLICQANHLVLSNDEVQKELDAAGVVRMKADWTKNDPIITEALSQFGRNSVPLYVMYGKSPEQEPTFLPQVLTPDVVINELKTTVGTKGDF